jgi:hypothetical protein
VGWATVCSQTIGHDAGRPFVSREQQHQPYLFAEVVQWWAAVLQGRHRPPRQEPISPTKTSTVQVKVSYGTLPSLAANPPQNPAQFKLKLRTVRAFEHKSALEGAMSFTPLLRLKRECTGPMVFLAGSSTSYRYPRKIGPTTEGY